MNPKWSGWRWSCLLLGWTAVSCSTITLQPAEQEAPMTACDLWATTTPASGASAVPVREQPTRQVQPSTHLPAGKRVKLRRSENGWLQTEDGWIFGTQLSVRAQNQALHVTPEASSPKTGIGNGEAFVVKCTPGWLYVVFERAEGKKMRGWMNVQKTLPQTE